MPEKPTAITNPTTSPENLRQLRAFLLKPGPELSKLEDCFDAVVEGRYESLFYEMKPQCSLIIPIIQAMVASRPLEFVALVDMVEANINSKYLTERNDNFACACLIGLIKGVTIINEESMVHLLSWKKDKVVKLNERFVQFIIFLLKMIGGNTESCYKTELSDAVAGFVGDSVGRTDNEWVQLSLLIKQILCEPGFLVGGRVPKPKKFLQTFFDELTFKVWSRATVRCRFKALDEHVMSQPTAS